MHRYLGFTLFDHAAKQVSPTPALGFGLCYYVLFCLHSRRPPMLKFGALGAWYVTFSSQPSSRCHILLKDRHASSEETENLDPINYESMLKKVVCYSARLSCSHGVTQSRFVLEQSKVRLPATLRVIFGTRIAAKAHKSRSIIFTKVLDSICSTPLPKTWIFFWLLSRHRRA